MQSFVLAAIVALADIGHTLPSPAGCVPTTPGLDLPPIPGISYCPVNDRPIAAPQTQPVEQSESHAGKSSKSTSESEPKHKAAPAKKKTPQKAPQKKPKKRPSRKPKPNPKPAPKKLYSGNNGGGKTYQATMTFYTGCNVPSACGWIPQKGYTAAMSEKLYDSPGPGKPGRNCGSCWLIQGKENSSKVPIKTTDIVVMINNECPSQGNGICSATSLTDPSKFSPQGRPVNVDLCDEDGAAAAFFGEGNKGMAYGQVTQVDCSQWKGSGNDTASWLST